MCMVSLNLLAILCCHTIDWDIFLRYWCLSQIYYYIIKAAGSFQRLFLNLQVLFNKGVNPCLNLGGWVISKEWEGVVIHLIPFVGCQLKTS